MPISYEISREKGAKAGLSAIALLTLTSIHHVYGAYIYTTPWRLHILYAAIPVGLIILAAMRLLGRAQNARWRRLLAIAMSVVILTFPVAMIGMFEGGYNHVVKNIVFLGAGDVLAQSMFPPPDYQGPDDLIFELTGLAQFPVGIAVARRAAALIREATR